jgi:hypothetical protein
MKITNQKLKQIIKEELASMLEQAPTGQAMVYFDPSGNIELQRVTKTGGNLNLPKSLLPQDLYNYLRKLSLQKYGERGMGQKAAQYLANSLSKKGYREEASSIDIDKLSQAFISR